MNVEIATYGQSSPPSGSLQQYSEENHNCGVLENDEIIFEVTILITSNTDNDNDNINISWLDDNNSLHILNHDPDCDEYQLMRIVMTI